MSDIQQVHVDGADAEVGKFFKPGEGPSGVMIMFTSKTDRRRLGLVLETPGKVEWLIDQLLTLHGEVWPPENAAELDAQGSRDDQAKFEGWRARIIAFTEDSDYDDASLREGARRFTLIEEIHGDIARRWPLGIAQQLAEVISALSCAGTCEDDEAVDLLDDLIDTERRSRALNGQAP